MDNEYLESVMQLIMYGGDAKSSAMEAIQAAKRNDFAAAEEQLNEAEKSLNKAHNSQTAFLQKEAAGEHVELTLLMVHGQDHLMNAISFCDLAKEIIELYQKINE